MESRAQESNGQMEGGEIALQAHVRQMMLIHMLESTFFLNVFSWGASVSGLFIGLLAVANYARPSRR